MGSSKCGGSGVALSLANVILLAMIVAVTGVAIYVQYFYQPELNPQYASEVLQEAAHRLEEHAPLLEKEAILVARDSWPILESAIVDQARHDYPLWAQSLEREGSTYFNSIEAAFLAKIKARYHDYLMQHQQILRDEFPEHATPENVQRVMAAFETTMGELVERYYLDQFREEAARSQRLWRAIPPARMPEEDEPALEEQLVATAQQWLMSGMTPTPP